MQKASHAYWVTPLNTEICAFLVEYMDAIIHVYTGSHYLCGWCLYSNLVIIFLVARDIIEFISTIFIQNPSNASVFGFKWSRISDHFKWYCVSYLMSQICPINNRGCMLGESYFMQIMVNICWQIFIIDHNFFPTII